MTDLNLFVDDLENLSIHQLEQLNRLLEVARRSQPAPGLSQEQTYERTNLIVRAVAQLRLGLSDEALDGLIAELRQIA